MALQKSQCVPMVAITESKFLSLKRIPVRKNGIISVVTILLGCFKKNNTKSNKKFLMRQTFPQNKPFYLMFPMIAFMLFGGETITPTPSLAAGGIQAPKAKELAGEMVNIPAGRFRMGDISGWGNKNEKPVYRVRIQSFSLGRYEVTVGQFRQFVNATDYRTEAERNIVKDGCFVHQSGTGFGWTAGTSWRNPGFTQEYKHPVVCVSWNDAEAYIDWLNRETGSKYRLPTEAEWEYAVRAGSESTYHFGNNEADLCRYGNVGDETTKKTAFHNLGGGAL